MWTTLTDAMFLVFFIFWYLLPIQKLEKEEQDFFVLSFYCLLVHSELRSWLAVLFLINPIVCGVRYKYPNEEVRRKLFPKGVKRYVFQENDDYAEETLLVSIQEEDE
jgi:hypothetical protein